MTSPHSLSSADDSSVQRKDNTPPLPPHPPPPSAYQQQQFYNTNTLNGFRLDSFNPDIPPICDLLYREADAWRAVMSLHSSTVSNSSHIVKTDTDSQSVLYYDEKALGSDSREASYYTALSSLAHQCDCLHSEALKLRTFRKARRQVELQCIKEIIRGHADEVMAIGQSLAQSSSLNVASATADLRVAIQTQRNQVSQLRMLLEAVASASTLPLPKGGKLAIGISFESDDTPSPSSWVYIDKLFEKIYEKSRGVNESSIAEALKSIRNVEEEPEASNKTNKHFARRSKS